MDSGTRSFEERLTHTFSHFQEIYLAVEMMCEACETFAQRLSNEMAVHTCTVLLYSTHILHTWAAVLLLLVAFWDRSGRGTYHTQDPFHFIQ